MPASPRIIPRGADILLVGASVRAAAHSALRAGMHPWCVDLFADADLRAHCPAAQLPANRYPAGFLEATADAPTAPWAYTGGLENYPSLVRQISQTRPLWGNDLPALGRARCPQVLVDLLRAADMPALGVRLSEQELPSSGRWVVKPYRGAGGAGVHLWDGRRAPGRGTYLQELVEGQASAAVYAGDGKAALLLGVTRQLVGPPWLHAPAFRYAGSLGPKSMSAKLHERLQRMGDVLASGCGLRGLFGVDLIIRDDLPWLVEVNPRYVASVEILEHALGVRAWDLHRRVFATTATMPPRPSPSASSEVVGKGILYARQSLTFPAYGPWEVDLKRRDVATIPHFADIPGPGERIPAGRPVITLFARGRTIPSCMKRLRRAAEDLDRQLLGR